MSGSNSRNMFLLIALFAISTIIFAYVIISKNVSDTISTDVEQVTFEEEE